ncbi:MAG: ECF transporter S component [Clostridiales bacterium]|nr:ECF transporter S component [Clostridiales bacterium]
MKISSKKIALYGVLSALMFLFLLVETYVFTAFLGAFTPAILTLPLAVAISIYSGKKGMWAGGTIFGCCSFFLAIIIANPVFINPLVSILPRILIGVIAYLVYLAVKLIFKNNKKGFLSETLPLGIAGVFGILTNTVCTIFMMFLFKATGIEAVLATVMSINFVAEVVGAIILVPIYVKVFNKIDK